MFWILTMDARIKDRTLMRGYMWQTLNMLKAFEHILRTRHLPARLWSHD